ncbi:MAG: TRAP transporter large permease subunit [bacterium]
MDVTHTEPATPVERVIANAERWSMVAIVFFMTLLPVLEVLGRAIFKSGVPGGLLYTQHLTLWIGFLGALIATGQGRHLALATGELIPPGKFRYASQIYVNTLSGAVAALLSYACARLVQSQMNFTGIAELPGGIKEWVSQLIMPVAMALVSLRFAWRASDDWVGRAIALAGIAVGLGLGKLEDYAEHLVWPGVIAVGIGMLVGTPVFVAMAGLAMLFYFAEGTAIASVPTETYRLVANPSLPAIPLLTMAGYILAEGGASKRLLMLARAFFGWMPGGIALVVCLVCALFTTFTGGSGVTILALGGLVLPMLLNEKYPEGFSLGLVTSSGSLGLLFPPSLPVILYAVVAGASVEELFLAGFLPGLLMLLLVAAYSIFIGARSHAPRTPFDLREAGRALWQAKWEVAIPAMVVTAIFTGFATMVEAAALAVLASVIVECAVFRDLHPTRELPVTIHRAATLVGAVLILLGVAMGLTSYFVEAEVPKALLKWTQAHIHSQVVFLLVLNGVLLVLGSVFEIFASIVILAPLLAPMAVAYGIDPLHLGIVFLANLELGFLFPPMGLNLILSSSRFGKPLTRLYREAFPFLCVLAVGVLLITYVPAMTQGFAHWVRPPKKVQATTLGTAPPAAAAGVLDD